MQYQVKIFDILMKGLEDEDYDSIIDQENLRAKGYSIHFVIDADLIGNYCYPEGIIKEETSKERLTKLNSDYIADEQVTLHTVFKLNKGTERVIFLDQYVYEFQAMIYKATKYGSKSSFDLQLPNFKISGGYSEFKEMLFNNFSKIIAEVLLKMNGLKKASNLFKERLIIFESEELKDDFLETAMDVCRGSVKNTENIIEIWEGLVGQKIYTSSKRDAVIFDRIFSLNNHVQIAKHTQDRKHLFLFLSDSSSAKMLLRHISSNKTKVDYPRIDNKIIDLIRSVPQTFAYLISLSYNDNKEIDHEATVENLRKLKTVSKKVSDKITNTERLLEQNDFLRQNSEVFSSDKYDKIFYNYRQLRNAFENTGLLKSFDGLYDSIQNEIKLLNIDDIHLVFERIKGEMKSLSKELNSEHSKYLRRLDEEATFTTTFINSIEEISTSAGTFYVSKGDDFVEGSYQHLPIFLIFPLESGEYRSHMNKLMLLILNRRVEESKQLYFELEALLDSMKNTKSNSGHQFEINLLKAFIFMILPSPNENIQVGRERKGRRTDRIAYTWLNFLTKNIETNNFLDSDLKYELCWVARRCGDYRESLDYANIGIERYPEDPRFYHGKFLAQYCLFEERGGNDQYGNDINSMLMNLEKARDLYIPFIKSKFQGFDTNLMISKLEDTFHNCYCYFMALKAYHLHNHKAQSELIIPLLDAARENINQLKGDGKYHDELPEYYDTEAYLEYLESFYKENKLQKAKYAQEAIEKAMSLSNHSGLIDKYSKKLRKIKERINELSQDKEGVVKINR